MRVEHLGDVCRFISGGTPSRSVTTFWDGAIPWVTGADLKANNVVKARAHITPQAVRESAASLVPAGTLLLVTRTSVGKVASAPTEMAFSQDITGVVPGPDVVDSDYLRTFLASQSEWLSRQARGATIKGVTRKEVADLRIPLPPLPEQRRIAAILDEADSLRTKSAHAEGTLDELARSKYREMFINHLSEAWPNASVADVAATGSNSIRTGPFGSQLLKEELVDAGVPVLGIDCTVDNEFRMAGSRFISDTKYEQLRRYTVQPGDVLITIMGTIGRCVVVPPDVGTAINTKHLACITLDKSKCLPEFLRATFLWNPEVRRYLGATGKGAIMTGLNMGIIKSLPFVLPPLELQREYVAWQSAVVAQRGIEQKRIREYDAIFGSLQHRAFRGEL